VDEHVVAGGVTEAIVDHLELVDVDEHDREGARVAVRALGLLLQTLVERAAVGELRERVGLSEHRQSRVRLGVGDRNARELREAVDAPLILARELAPPATQGEHDAPRLAVDDHGRRDSVQHAEHVGAGAGAGVEAARRIGAAAQPRERVVGLVAQDRAGRDRRRRSARPGADVAVSKLVLETQHVAGVGLQQARNLLGDEREDLIGGSGRGDARRDPLQCGLLARERLRALGIVAQGAGAVVLLDRELGEMDRTIDDALVAGSRPAGIRVVQRERPEHGAGGRSNRRRPAAMYPVRGAQIGERGRERVARDVVDDHHLVAKRAGGAHT